MTIAVGAHQATSLFLIGGPRCGTTSTAKALRKHPEICVSQPKETYFFYKPPADVPNDHLGAEFLSRYFPHFQPPHRVLFEATPHHLYDDHAIELILAFDPDARFVVNVRNPIDLVASHHRRVLFTMDEDVKDLATAWSLQQARQRGECLPRRCRDPRVLRYGDIGSLGAHLEALFLRVGRERCHVIVFDDLAAKGRETLQALLRFIGVDPEPEIALGHSRENAGYRLDWLQPWLMNPPSLVARRVEKWDRSGKGRSGWLKPLRRRLKKWNTLQRERPPLDPALHRELSDFFAPDVEKLAKLLDRDLSHWR